MAEDEGSMADPKFPLTLTGRHFSMTPCAPFLDERCTATCSCQEPATHRLLFRRTSVEWLCNRHALAWAEAHGIEIPQNAASNSAA